MFIGLFNCWSLYIELWNILEITIQNDPRQFGSKIDKRNHKEAALNYAVHKNKFE